MSETEFNSEKHKFAESSYFEDLTVGQKFYIPSRTLRDANFSAFQAASGDNHPIHYDVEYCKSQGHPELLAHGFQVLIQTASGAGVFPHVIGEALIAFIDQSSKFLGPVYYGDTVYPELVIKEKKEQNSTGVVTVRSTVHNQRKELVLEGEQRYLIRKRPSA
jgi:acyl dehydratase